MEGLVFLANIPDRVAREEFQILYDEPVYRMVKQFASKSDMQEIDGWARSFYTLEGHVESILQYRKPLLQEPTYQEWLMAKEEVRDEVRGAFAPVQSLDFNTQFDIIPYEGSSAAGYGYHGKKGEGDNFKRAKGIANALVRTFVEETQSLGIEQATANVIQNSTPDIGFTRTQLAKLPSIKVRNVFGEAFHYILIEGLSASPLLEAFKREDTFYVSGKDPTTYVPRYLTELDKYPGWIIALDWSKFDATVQLWEIDHAFHCIEQILTFPNVHTQAAFEISKILFKQRKLAAPDGVLWMRISGIPSGSYFTNLIGSIINYTRVRYVCNRMGFNVLSARVQGDDSIIKIDADTKPNMFEVSDIIAEHGWALNPLKCTVSQTSEWVTFLGRSQLQLFNIRERMKILRLMCFPEYKVDDPKISTARVRMIARDAGFRDPIYNKILYAMLRLYGEAPSVPAHLRTFVDVVDWNEVNM